MGTYIARNTAGALIEKAASTASTGAVQAGTLVALDSAGKIDETILPPGLGSLITNASGTLSLDISLYNKWLIILLSDTVISFDDTSVTNTETSMLMVIRQGAGGGYTPTFSGDVVWIGTPPTWSTTEGAKDVISVFRFDGSTTWYLAKAGLDYRALLTGATTSAAQANVLCAGSFVKKASDYENTTATITAFGTLITPGAVAVNSQATVGAFGSKVGYISVAMEATAAATAASVLANGGAVDFQSAAFINAVAHFEHQAAVSVQANASVTATGSTTFYIPAAAALSSTATAAFGGAANYAAAAAVSAGATVTAVGAVPIPPLTVTLTDSTIQSALEQAPYGAYWSGEGVTLTHDGTGPFDYTVEVLSWQEDTYGNDPWQASQTGCSGVESIILGGSSLGKTACKATVTGLSSLSLTNTGITINYNGLMLAYVQITVTDSLGATGSDTAHIRWNGVY